jgi:DNA topoisomerase VI subunit A
MGLDLRQLDFNVDRMAMSAKSHDEKLAKIRPEAEYVLMKYLGFESSPTGISTRTSLRIPLDEARKHCHELNVAAILVVENLDVFDVIHQARLPENLTHVMVIYRGSGHHSPIGVRHFLQAMTDKLPIIAFTDLDPAGLQIAHTLMGVTHCLVPQLVLTAPAELLARAQINSTDDFDKQAKQAKYLQNAELKHWQKLAVWLNQHQISIKQQHLLAHGLELVLVPYI